MPEKKGEGNSTGSKTAAKTSAKTTAAKKPIAKTAAGTKTSAVKKPAAKTVTAKTVTAKTAADKKPALKSTAAKPAAKTTTTAKKAATTVKKPAAKTTTVKKPAERTKTAAKTSAAKETVKKAPAKAAAAKTAIPVAKKTAAMVTEKKEPASMASVKKPDQKRVETTIPLPHMKKSISKVPDNIEAFKKSLLSNTEKNPTTYKSELQEFKFGNRRFDFWKRSGIIVNKNSYSETELEIEATTNTVTKEVKTRVTDRYTSHTTTIAVKDSSNAVFTVDIPECSISLFEGNKVTLVGIKKASKDTGYYCIIKNETIKKWFLIYSARQLNIKFSPPGILGFLIVAALAFLTYKLPIVGVPVIVICLLVSIVSTCMFNSKLNKHLFEIGYFLNIPSEKNKITMANMRKAYRKTIPSVFAWLGFILAALTRALSGNNDMTNTVNDFSRKNRSSHNCIK